MLRILSGFKGASGQQILADAMKAERIKGEVFPTVKQIVNAYALFEKNIFEAKLCRMEQPALTAVVTNWKKVYSDFVVDGPFGPA